MHHKLDNPVWHALDESHQKFALTFDEIKFYKPAYCPFGAFQEAPTSASPLEDYALQADSFYVVGERPTDDSHKIHFVKELVCDQMVLHSAINIPFTENITPLNERYTKELLELVNLVQPGYFKAETVQLGKYFGIFKEIKGEPTLVAVTGERMRMNDYTEVSAVVTHPEHGGRGYAKQLVAHVANQVIAEGKMPFLHVAESNLGAIKLYEKLGFKLRRKISFWNYTRR